MRKVTISLGGFLSLEQFAADDLVINCTDTPVGCELTLGALPQTFIGHKVRIVTGDNPILFRLNEGTGFGRYNGATFKSKSKGYIELLANRNSFLPLQATGDWSLPRSLFPDNFIKDGIIMNDQMYLVDGGEA